MADGVDLQAMALKRVTLPGSTMRARTPREKAQIAAELRQHVWPLLAVGLCRPSIHQVFRLMDAPLAHAMTERGDHTGKIVLQIAD